MRADEDPEPASLEVSCERFCDKGGESVSANLFVAALVCGDHVTSPMVQMQRIRRVKANSMQNLSATRRAREFVYLTRQSNRFRARSWRAGSGRLRRKRNPIGPGVWLMALEYFNQSMVMTFHGIRSPRPRSGTQALCVGTTCPMGECICMPVVLLCKSLARAREVPFSRRSC